jgi:glycine C-acetyltransferase
MTYRETRFENELKGIREEGLFKAERVITTPQGVVIGTTERRDVINFCANNYLGLANHPEIVQAAIDALRRHGFGMASVRFICGTQDLHKELERAIAAFLGTEDAILYGSCFDANTGLFEALLGEEDAVISDALNHASIIDGIRLCKAARLRFAHGDMADLERQLQTVADRRTRLIVSDGVFSMDGDIARLDDMVELAEKYRALVVVDDSHGTGVIGARGRGSGEHRRVLERVDIYTSTLGKALGGGAGGFTASRREIVELLRQRSRPYLFSNTLAPPLVAAALKALELITRSAELRERLWENTAYFRRRMRDAGFDIRPGEHPIVPIMLYEAHLSQQMAAALLDEGIYVIGFSYPVVPKGQARIRVQITAAHTRAQLDRAVEAFGRVGRSLGVIR